MKLTTIVGITVALLIAAFVCAVAFTLYEAEHYQQRLGESLERELGFRHGSPYVHFGASSREVFTLHPVPDGVLAAAGVRDGDIPPDFSITGFYKHLHRNRGSQATVLVMDGGDGSPETQRPIRTVRFYVPTRRSR